jgi:DNA-binding NarL/FixJ family response regulator
MSKTRIILADDHQVVIDGLASLIKGLRGFEVMAIAKNGHEVLDLLAQEHPDILLMDISMDEMDGLEAMEHIQKNHPDLKVIILSTHLSGAYARTLLSKGVKGYLQKDCSQEELKQALCDVRDGSQYLSKNITEVLVQESGSIDGGGSETPKPKISKRELEVLELIHEEHPTRAIAEILDISFHTVEAHRRHLLNKFGVKSTVGLIREGMRLGLLE